jgi:hypothetical protein
MRFDPAKRTFIAANQIKSAEIDNYSSSLLSGVVMMQRKNPTGTIPPPPIITTVNITTITGGGTAREGGRSYKICEVNRAG